MPRPPTTNAAMRVLGTAAAITVVTGLIGGSIGGAIGYSTTRTTHGLLVGMAVGALIAIPFVPPWP